MSSIHRIILEFRKTCSNITWTPWGSELHLGNHRPRRSKETRLSVLSKLETFNRVLLCPLRLLAWASRGHWNVFAAECVLNCWSVAQRRASRPPAACLAFWLAVRACLAFWVVAFCGAFWRSCRCGVPRGVLAICGVLWRSVVRQGFGCTIGQRVGCGRQRVHLADKRTIGGQRAQ